MLTESDIIEIAKLYSAKVDTIKSLNGFHNYMYEISGDTDFILRVSQQQNTVATSCEIDFLLYLYRHDVRVAPPVPSLGNQYVNSVVVDEVSYTVSAYKKAVGRDFRSRGIDGKERFVKAGRELGKIHKLSKAYAPSSANKRRQWYENPHLVKAPYIFAGYSLEVGRKFRSFMSQMLDLPKEPNGFGLVHGDFLFSNFFFDDDNNITIFDFDECEYSWYMYDIAVCMYYYLLGADPRELYSKAEEAEDMLYYLLLGYNELCHVDLNSLKIIDLLFRLRDFVLLSSILESISKETKGWSRHFVEGAVDRLLTDKPFIPIDIEKVYNNVLAARQNVIKG